MKKYILFFAIAISAIACSQKETDSLEESSPKVRFTAILDGIDLSTKTVLGAEENDLYPVYWSEGDRIKMFVSQHEVSDGQGYRLDLESGAGTVESVFSGSVPALPDGSLYYYAVYPYSLAASIGGANPGDSGTSPAEGTWDPGDGNVWEKSNYVQVPLPSVQQYSPHSFGKDYNPAIAVSRDQTLRFKNACGLLRINLTGNVKVGKITVLSDGEAALWGTLLARYRWRQNSSDYEFRAYVTNGQMDNAYQNSDRKLLTLNCGEGVQLSNDETDFYLVLPTLGSFRWDNGHFYDQTHSPLDEGFTIRIYDTEGNEVYAKHTDRDNSIHRSIIRNMPTLDVRTQVLTDLSANGTANSYIVNPDGGSYRFFAGNRGSSMQPIHDGGASALTTANAVILWETKMSGDDAPELHDIIDNVSYDPSTQYISFNSTLNEGNALIAIKDSNDKIVWSWHIWSTNYNPEGVGNTDTYGSVVLMDRNLGALQKDAGNVNFYGLYYQWGRKDPLDADYSLSKRKYLYFPSNPFGTDTGKKTLEYIASHPTTYLSGDDIYYGIDRDMPLADISHLWGPEKTMYDPCPPGWKVPDFDTFYQYADSYSNPSFSITDNGSWVLFTSSTPDAVYPKEPIWTNHHNFTYWGAVSFQMDSFGKHNSSSDRKHVRCQRENNTIDLRPVIDLSASGTANCYMARPKKKYKFNASVKGNSTISTGMAANAKINVYTENTTTLSGSRYSALEAEDVLIMDCYLKDGYIYFSTSLDEVYGNATIVLRDPQGHILWSWHIWIVDYNPESNYDTIDWGEVGDKKFMKMNLGALNNTMYDSRAMGMMYQWGRKDPFMGAAAYDSNSQVMYETYSDAEYGSVEASVSTSTLAYSLRHPSIAIMDEATEGDGDWLADHENALWGETKTMYDPCPRGWKVPTRPIFTSHSVSCVYQYGLQMDGIWYPAAGFHHYVSFNLNEVGNEGHYWYSTPKDDGHAYSFFFDAPNKTVDLANHYTPKAQLNAIRCMKDE